MPLGLRAHDPKHRQDGYQIPENTDAISADQRGKGNSSPCMNVKSLYEYETIPKSLEITFRILKSLEINWGTPSPGIQIPKSLRGASLLPPFLTRREIQGTVSCVLALSEATRRQPPSYCFCPPTHHLGTSLFPKGGTPLVEHTDYQEQETRFK